MKPRRLLLTGLGVVVLLLILLVVLAFNSGVQTWAARRALAAQPDISGEIGRVDVGLKHVQARDVVLRLSGMNIQLPAVDVDMAVARAAREQIEVSRLVAKGWTLDLTAPVRTAAARPRQLAGLIPLPLAQATGTPATQPATATEFPIADLLAALELPVDLHRLDGMELAGTVIFPSASGGSPGRAQVTITGGGLSPGQDGKFHVTADTQLQDPEVPVGRLQLDSQITARLRDPRRFARVESVSSVDASGGQLPQATQLRVDAAAGSGAEGGMYSLQLRTNEKTLLDLQARPVTPGSSELAGQWRIAINDGDVAPFMLGMPLPQFQATGEGQVEFSGSDNSAGLAGALQVRIARLETLQPELQSIGELTATTNFDARKAGDDLRVTQLRLVLSGARPVIEVEALQGLEFNTATGELRVADPDTELLDLQLRGLPLEWAQPFVEGYTITGGPLQGSWRAAARDGGFVLRSTTPLRSGGLSVSSPDGPLLQGVDLGMSVSGEYVPSGWQGRIENGHLQSGTVRWLTFESRAGQALAPGAALVATTRFNVDLAGALPQPVMEPYRMVQAGSVSGDAIVALGQQVELAAEFLLNGLVANGETMPRVSLKARADRTEDGRIEAHVPIQVTQNGRASDLTLNAQLRPVDEVMHIEARLTGQHLFVQDLQILGAPFAASEETAEPSEPSSGPPWSGVRGKLNMAFGTVVYSDALSANNVEGEIAITEEALTINGLSAALGTGGTIEMKGGLSYQENATESYSLDSNVTAQGVDVGPLFRALNPNSTPPVDGRFDFTSRIAGQAAELEQLGDRAQVEARLNSRGGTLRALPVRIAEAARTGGSALAGVAGLIGGLTGDTRAQRLAENTRAATDFAQAIGALNFDQLNVEVARGANGEMAIRDISLISPMVRLLGSGAIASRENTPFWQAPLNVRLQLAARGTVADQLRTLRLLSAEADKLGYTPMVEDFSLEGTLYNISVPRLQALLTRALTSFRSDPAPSAEPAPAPAP